MLDGRIVWPLMRNQSSVSSGLPFENADVGWLIPAGVVALESRLSEFASCACRSAIVCWSEAAGPAAAAAAWVVAAAGLATAGAFWNGVTWVAAADWL